MSVRKQSLSGGSTVSRKLSTAIHCQAGDCTNLHRYVDGFCHEHRSSVAPSTGPTIVIPPTKLSSWVMDTFGAGGKSMLVKLDELGVDEPGDLLLCSEVHLAELKSGLKPVQQAKFDNLLQTLSAGTGSAEAKSITLLAQMTSASAGKRASTYFAGPEAPAEGDSDSQDSVDEDVDLTPPNMHEASVSEDSSPSEEDVPEGLQRARSQTVLNTVLKEGWLMKKPSSRTSHIMNKWRKRYVVLQGGSITYYKNAQKLKPLGLLLFSSMTTIDKTDDPKQKHSIELLLDNPQPVGYGLGISLVVAASSAEECEAWISSFQESKSLGTEVQALSNMLECAWKTTDAKDLSLSGPLTKMIDGQCRQRGLKSVWPASQHETCTFSQEHSSLLLDRSGKLPPSTSPGKTETATSRDGHFYGNRFLPCPSNFFAYGKKLNKPQRVILGVEDVHSWNEISKLGSVSKWKSLEYGASSNAILTGRLKKMQEFTVVPPYVQNPFLASNSVLSECVKQASKSAVSDFMITVLVAYSTDLELSLQEALKATIQSAKDEFVVVVDTGRLARAAQPEHFTEGNAAAVLLVQMLAKAMRDPQVAKYEDATFDAEESPLFATETPESLNAKLFSEEIEAAWQKTRLALAGKFCSEIEAAGTDKKAVKACTKAHDAERELVCNQITDALGAHYGTPSLTYTSLSCYVNIAQGTAGRKFGALSSSDVETRNAVGSALGIAEGKSLPSSIDSHKHELNLYQMTHLMLPRTTTTPALAHRDASAGVLGNFDKNAPSARTGLVMFGYTPKGSTPSFVFLETASKDSNHMWLSAVRSAITNHYRQYLPRPLSEEDAKLWLEMNQAPEGIVTWATQNKITGKRLRGHSFKRAVSNDAHVNPEAAVILLNAQSQLQDRFRDCQTALMSIPADMAVDFINNMQAVLDRKSMASFSSLVKMKTKDLCRKADDEILVFLMQRIEREVFTKFRRLKVWSEFEISDQVLEAIKHEVYLLAKRTFANSTGKKLSGAAVGKGLAVMAGKVILKEVLSAVADEIGLGDAMGGAVDGAMGAFGGAMSQASSVLENNERLQEKVDFYAGKVEDAATSQLKSIEGNLSEAVDVALLGGIIATTTRPTTRIRELVKEQLADSDGLSMGCPSCSQQVAPLLFHPGTGYCQAGVTCTRKAGCTTGRYVSAAFKQADGSFLAFCGKCGETLESASGCGEVTCFWPSCKSTTSLSQVFHFTKNTEGD
jgi:hypothetical protein